MAITVSDLYIGGVKMPTPAIEGVTVSREKIWSSDTGRTASGKLVGTIVSIKTKVSIKWPSLTMAQVKTIEDAVSTATEFLTIRFTDMTGTTKTYTGYLSSPTYTIYSYADGMQWVNGASVDFVEQ